MHTIHQYTGSTHIRFEIFSFFSSSCASDTQSGEETGVEAGGMSIGGNRMDRGRLRALWGIHLAPDWTGCRPEQHRVELCTNTQQIVETLACWCGGQRSEDALASDCDRGEIDRHSCEVSIGVLTEWTKISPKRQKIDFMGLTSIRPQGRQNFAFFWLNKRSAGPLSQQLHRLTPENLFSRDFT